MRFWGIILFALVTTSLLTFVVYILVRFLNPSWWKLRWVRVSLMGLFLFTLSAAILWRLAHAWGASGLMQLASVGVTVGIVAYFSLVISLPLSGLANGIGVLADHLASLRMRRLQAKAKNLDRPQEKEEQLLGQGPLLSRRNVLKASATAFPFLTLSMGNMGIARAFSSTRVYRLPMRFENLPPRLQGLRILHLTDTHLGIFKFLDDLKEILDKAAQLRPDLILITGDLADDLALLPKALSMMAQKKPRLGVFAVPGNHEYSRGILDVVKAFQESPATLLIGEGVTLNVEGAKLYLAGADDPRHMRRESKGFLKATVTQALAGAPDGAFRILMSHRPQSFDSAARLGVELTLSGHTHGGQIGLNGRSFFRHLIKNSYLWGVYRRDRSQMYLSSGVGHWFPFRLACPSEAPVIELVSG